MKSKRDVYKENIGKLSDMMVKAQKPIRILDAIKWDKKIEQEVIDQGKNFDLRKLKKIYYQNKKPKFDAQKKLEEFQYIREKIQYLLGSHDPIGKIMTRNCRQYEDVVLMLNSCGTSNFYEYSKKLYGSPDEILDGGSLKLSSLGHTLRDILTVIPNSNPKILKKTLTSENIVVELQNKLNAYFSEDKIVVKLSDGIISDAAAGSDYIKVKEGMMFSQSDLNIFEVHEGHVHLGTTLNGKNQSFARWLHKGPPSSTVTQEGLAVLMEVFQFVISPERAKKLNNRLVACDMALKGANLLEVMEYFSGLGLSPEDAFTSSARVFRGGDPEGGAPFTKDISYCKGFITTYNFIRNCVRKGRTELIPYLFVGKVSLDEIPILYEYSEDQIIDPPKYLPSQFKDMNGLIVWMAFSNFLNKMKLDSLPDPTLSTNFKMTA